MKRMGKLIGIVLSIGFVLTACQKSVTGLKQEETIMNESDAAEIQEESISNENETSTVEENISGYEIESFIPESEKEKQFDWVIIQYGRKTLNQKDVNAINKYLQQKLEASIAFHIVTLEGYVTPTFLQELYEKLDGNMDFVSFGRDLSAFDMEEWKENFIELSEYLKEGALDAFYKTVPEIAWEVNMIDNGIYSFSNSTQVFVQGYGFSTEIQEKYGREQLLKLQTANGTKNEEGWVGMYEVCNEPVCVWSSLSWGQRADASENPYMRKTLGQLTNGFEDNDFVELTDDIQFDIEKGEFVWLPENEKYVEIKETTKEFYDKGYLKALKIGEQMQANLFVGDTVLQHEVNIDEEESSDLWVPLFEKNYVRSYQCGNDFLYSFVYYQAEKGWEEVLDVIGSSEGISRRLNQYSYDVTISALVYGELPGRYMPRIADRYELVQTVYSEMERNPIEGFIFNPLPIEKEWIEYNRLSSAYAGIAFTRYSAEDNKIVEPNFEAIDMVWNAYLEMKEEAHVDLVLEEVNRQYKEWKENK